MKNKHITIIGGPNAGKTHFGAQLYGRLSAKTQYFRITSPPGDLTLFKEVLDNLNQGRSSGHTHYNQYETLSLEIENNKGQQLTFSFPDYGGEQIKTIVTEHRLNETWKEQITQSDAWMLFIRPTDILVVEDVVNRGVPKQEILKQRNESAESVVLSDAAFYIELLQIFLYVKKRSLKHRFDSPKLTIVLSCWDLLPDAEQQLTPIEVLKGRLPALCSFLDATWQSDAWQIIGLSSLEKTLSDKIPDEEVVIRGPEAIGYVITKEGINNKDLTLSISTFLE